MMNDFEQEKDRFKLEAKQHELDLTQYSISEDLAAQVDRLHATLERLRIRYHAIAPEPKPAMPRSVERSRIDSINHGSWNLGMTEIAKHIGV